MGKGTGFPYGRKLISGSLANWQISTDPENGQHQPQSTSPNPLGWQINLRIFKKTKNTSISAFRSGVDFT